MDKASEAILVLKPVSFRYKKEIDPDLTPQFGLVAEDVGKINPDLVVRDAGGKVYTVRDARLKHIAELEQISWRIRPVFPTAPARTGPSAFTSSRTPAPVLVAGISCPRPMS